MADLKYVKCDLCGEDNATVWMEGLPESQEGGLTPEQRYSSSSNVIGNDRIVKCRNCGLMYVNPQLDASSIVGGYAEGVDENYVAQAEGRMRTFRSGLKIVERHSGLKTPGKILDVGAAAGFFVKVAKEAGWEAVGVEPSKWLSRYGRETLGVDMRAGILKDQKFPDNSFDVITMWDVLEHTPSPTEELKEAWRVLKPGGLLITNVPDMASLPARIAGKKFWFILSVHLYYFTPKTIRAMLTKCGFEPFAKRRHWQKLGLGYLCFRMEPYFGPLAKFAGWTAKTFRLANLQMPYTAGQTNFLSRKKAV